MNALLTLSLHNQVVVFSLPRGTFFVSSSPETSGSCNTSPHSSWRVGSACPPRLQSYIKKLRLLAVSQGEALLAPVQT